MNNFVLFCKTFSRDLNRVQNLVESVTRFNMDTIPMYISVPKAELSLFRDTFSGTIVGDTILTDEDISQISGNNWYNQQVVKSSFWKTGITKNFLLLDSDSYFIRPFYLSDFMYNEDTPYTVMHEQKDLFEFSDRYKEYIGFDPRGGYEGDRKKIMSILGRGGRLYDFGPSPVIWSTKVWESLWNNFMLPNNITEEGLIKLVASEFTWYGEHLLNSRPIDIIPVGPLFKVFHYPSQYEFYKQQGYTEETFSPNYMGLVIQSNFSKTIRY